jgi:multidrug resistance efflux pump
VAAHSSNDRAIAPRPYEIRLAQAIAQLETASARFELAKRELWRAQELKRTDFGTMQNVDQRAADLQAAQASVDDAKAQIRDAQFDLLALPHHGPLHRRRLESKKADLPSVLFAVCPILHLNRYEEVGAM